MSLRAIIIALLLSLVSVAWIHQASLVQTQNQYYAPVYLCSVPPVPALVFLVLLVALQRGLARWGVVRTLSRRELLVIYAFLVLAIPPVTFGIIELLLPWVTAPVYLSSPQQDTAALAVELPGWFYPHDDEVIRQMYEGSDTAPCRGGHGCGHWACGPPSSRCCSSPACAW